MQKDYGKLNILLCKAKRQYLPTCKVSRYFACAAVCIIHGIALIQQLALTVVPVVAVVLWSVAASSAGGVEGRRGAAAGSAGGSVED